MELWWWVEPLFKTGMVTLAVAGLLAFTFHDSGDWLFFVCCVLLIPLVVVVGAVVVWGLINLFLAIWKPYF